MCRGELLDREDKKSFKFPRDMKSSSSCLQPGAVVGPGALTPLALINDRMNRVTPIFDQRLMDARQLNFHPLVNNQSLGISPRDLLTFIASCGHLPVLAELATMEDATRSHLREMIIDL